MHQELSYSIGYTLHFFHHIALAKWSNKCASRIVVLDGIYLISPYRAREMVILICIKNCRTLHSPYRAVETVTLTGVKNCCTRWHVSTVTILRYRKCHTNMHQELLNSMAYTYCHHFCNIETVTLICVKSCCILLSPFHAKERNTTKSSKWYVNSAKT